MLIIAIAWLYVALMLSLGANSLVGACLTFLGWGVLPLSLFWYLFGRKQRKPAPARDEPAEPTN